MRSLEESIEILYVIRTMDVLLGSGVGLEATIHSISGGGYGIISEDFAQLMKSINKGTSLEKELRALQRKCESDGYKRLINTMLNNVTQNTDIVETLRKQGSRMEEERSEAVKKYIETLSGLPETLLSIGMIGPLIMAILGVVPQLVDPETDITGISGYAGVMNSVVAGGLFLSLLFMFFLGLKTHTKDPGL